MAKINIIDNINNIINLIELEILNAHKYKDMKKFGLGCYFFPLINVKMPTIVGILTYMSGENFMLI